MARRVYIIAEMACSHEGDPDLAKKIIDGAGKAGADAVQFQIFSQKERAVPHHPDFDLLGKLELSDRDWTDLAGYARRLYPEMEIIACVYEDTGVRIAERIQADAYKIHSADLSNPRLLNRVASTGKRIDLSVGASTLDEITRAVDLLRNRTDAAVWLMYGMQTFPTPTEAANLGFMRKLQDLFELPVGYQDHSDADSEAAFYLPAAAVGMGVDILEKHITHNRSLGGVDHEAALNPDEFERFVRMVRDLEAAWGIPVPKPFSEEEMKYRRYAKKSIVAARDLPGGTRVQESDLKFMFADSLGLPPDRSHEIIGRITQKPIAGFQLITENDVR